VTCTSVDSELRNTVVDEATQIEDEFVQDTIGSGATAGTLKQSKSHMCMKVGVVESCKKGSSTMFAAVHMRAWLCVCVRVRACVCICI
jgi:hypothetical protein